MLGALGPKMVRLSTERSAGAHPYHVTPKHTADTRKILGPEPILATELAVVLEGDADIARATARQHLRSYMEMPNYTNTYRRYGFVDQDFENSGSDRLVDALVARGSVGQIRDRVREHLDAGADHVCIQALTFEGRITAEETWTKLAPLLLTT
jgi:probable F420-dependent oxidoreductase